MIHISPRWGFKTFGNPVCYKHVAPLGLKKLTQTFIMHIAHSAEKPLDPFDVSYNPKYVFDAEALYTCRPAGALRLLGTLRAIHIALLWSANNVSLL